MSFSNLPYTVSSKIVHLILLACLEMKLIRLFNYNHHHQRNSTNQQIYTHFMCSVYSIIAKYDLLNCVLLTIHNYSWHVSILWKYHNYVFPTYIVYFLCRHSSWYLELQHLFDIIYFFVVYSTCLLHFSFPFMFVPPFNLPHVCSLLIETQFNYAIKLMAHTDPIVFIPTMVIL